MPEDNTSTVAPLAEINLGPSKFEQFLENNQKLLAVLLTLLVIGSAAYIVFRGVEKSREHSAGASLGQAKDIPALQEVINQHANTNAAASARLLLADMLAAEGKSEAAIQTLQNFIATNADHTAKPSASAKLAAQLMSQGKTAEASTIFQAIASDPRARYIAPYALICLGDIAKAGGDPTKAESYFNQVKTEFAESSFVGTAAERLATAKTKAPTEIDPAPPAAKPATSKPTPDKKAEPKPTKSTQKDGKTKN